MHQNLRGSTTPQEVHDDIEHLRVQNGRRLEIFAGGRGAGENEDARTNDRADAQGRQRPRAQRLLQFSLRVFRLGDQLVDGFAAEKLTVGGAHNVFGWRLAGAWL